MNKPILFSELSPINMRTIDGGVIPDSEGRTCTDPRRKMPWDKNTTYPWLTILNNI